MAYKIVTWHGEGKTLFYVVEHSADDESDWNVVGTFTNKNDAEKFIKQQNERG